VYERNPNPRGSPGPSVDDDVGMPPNALVCSRLRFCAQTHLIALASGPAAPRSTTPPATPVLPPAPIPLFLFYSPALPLPTSSHYPTMSSSCALSELDIQLQKATCDPFSLNRRTDCSHRSRCESTPSRCLEAAPTVPCSCRDKS